MKYTEFKDGFRDGIPICLGYFSVSFAYGMTAVLAGLPFWAAVLISLTNLTSAGQVAGTNLILAQAAYMEIMMTTLIINIRYFLMSLSVSQKVENGMSMWKRMFVAFGITDEIFAVSVQRKKDLSAAYMAGLILTPVFGWVGGTALGGAITSLMPDSIAQALNIALYGMFIAIVVPVAKKQKAVFFTAVFAILLSVMFTYVPLFKMLSGGWGIIVITIVVSAVAALLFPVAEEGKEA